MTLKRIKKLPDQRIGNDSVYGSGYDGDNVISGTFIMNRDYYWNNLTINGSGILFTNGYRVFVRDTLTMANGAKLGLVSTVSQVNTFGTLIGRGSDLALTKEYVLGDSATGTQVPASIIKDLNFSIKGWHYDPIDGFKRVEGADDGTQGANVAGSAPPAPPPAPAPPAGIAGIPGNPGGSAVAPANPGNPGNPGAVGNPGNPGSLGNPGNPGAVGTGGLGGEGGGMVVVVAKHITYTGGAGSAVIESWGRAGYTGDTGAQGTSGNPGATPGNPGNTGGDGTDGNPGHTFTEHHTASTINPPNLVITGYNPSTTPHHETSSTTPGNQIHVVTQHGGNYANTDCKADYNPDSIHHTRSNAHHHTNPEFGAYSANFAWRSQAHHQVYAVGNATGNHHCVNNYNPIVYGHAASNSYNPSTTSYHNTPGTPNPSNPNYTDYGSNANQASHIPTRIGGNPGSRGFGGAGGGGGAPGAGGAGGAGGTGATGTAGLRGGVLVVCDTKDASVDATNGGYGTVLLNS